MSGGLMSMLENVSITQCINFNSIKDDQKPSEVRYDKDFFNCAHVIGVIPLTYACYGTIRIDVAAPNHLSIKFQIKSLKESPYDPTNEELPPALQ